MQNQSAPHVVIIGGGFGGAYAARTLLRRTHGNVNVTVVSATNSLVFAPRTPATSCDQFLQNVV